MPRTALLSDWIKQMFRPQFAEEEIRIEPASADASFRSYFRVHLPDRNARRIVMDAPPEKEDCHPFVDIASLFQQAGVHVPEVIAQDLEQGFLLLSDLGSTTYLQALAGQASSATTLSRRQQRTRWPSNSASRPGLLPDYDQALLQRELALFPDWYLGRTLAWCSTMRGMQTTLHAVFAALLANNLAQRTVFVHRDYHSRNLMVIGDRSEAIPDQPRQSWTSRMPCMVP
jgi:aminoglycoside/choline kinase family phosphotransferase